MTTATADTPSSRWDGGVSPYEMSWQKLMMWVFIAGDALLFGAFLACYGFSRLAAGDWPDQTAVFGMNFITAMTFILITSSATMATAVAAARKGDKRVAAAFVLATMAGGMAFLGCQAVEWSHVIADGGRLDFSPYPGAVEGGQIPAFTAYFFMVTGFHGTHVAIGVVILLVTAIRNLRGSGTADGVELAGLYWHAVDLFWVFIFGCFYLI